MHPMSYQYEDLRAFIKRLEKEGELKRIPVEVDPVLEIAEITDRVSKPVFTWSSLCVLS